MKLTGAADEIARFKQTCITPDEGFDFNTLVPMPEAVRASLDQTHGLQPGNPFPDWYEWRCENWGTKWNASAFYAETDEATCFACSFDTAWAPPEPVWRKLGEVFPTLEIDISGSCGESDYAFGGSIREGQLELHWVPLIWQVTDPKTGEIVRGTRDEIEAALTRWQPDKDCLERTIIAF
jgi:hypothetical protein